MAKYQQGYGTLPVIAAIIGAGALSVGASMYLTSERQQVNVPELIATDMQALHSAALAYLDDHRERNSFAIADNPNFLQDLIAQGYYEGSLESPVGTLYQSRVVDDKLVIDLHGVPRGYAQTAASLVPDAEIGQERISSTIKLPSRSELYADYAGRYQDPDKPYRQQFETDISLGEHNLQDVNTAQMQFGELDEIDVAQMQMDTLDVNERVDLGDALTMTESGGALSVDGALVDLNTPRINLGGDLTGSGAQSATIAGQVQGEIGEFNDMQIEDIIETETLAAQDAGITSLAGTELRFNAGTLESVDTGSLRSEDATITELQGDTLAFDSGVVGTTQTDTVTAQSGQVAALEGQSLQYASGQIEQGRAATARGNTLSYAAGSVGSADTGTLVASTASIQSLQGQSIDFSNANIQTLESASVTITQRLTGQDATIERLDSDRVDAAQMNASGTVTADTLDVSGNTDVSNTLTGQSGTATTVAGQTATVSEASGDQVAAHNLTTESLNTDSIQSEQSSVGAATASSLNVTNTASMYALNASVAQIGGTVEFTQGSGGSMALGGQAQANTATMETVNAVTVSASDDVYSSHSSINQNYAQVTTLIDDLTHCMEVSEWCKPQKPVVSLSCSLGGNSCSQSSKHENFTATVNASIQNCRHGCSYTWNVSGLDVVSGCTNGTIAEGSAGTPSCRVANSNPVARQSTVSGFVSITVTNQLYTDENVSDNQDVSFRNSANDDPWLDNEVKITCNTSNSSECERTDKGSGASISFTDGFSLAPDFTWSDYERTGSLSVSGGSDCSGSYSGGTGGTLSKGGTTYDDCSGAATATVRYVGTYPGTESERNKTQSHSDNIEIIAEQPEVFYSAEFICDNRDCRSEEPGASKADATGHLQFSGGYPSSEYNVTYTYTPPAAANCDSYVNAGSAGVTHNGPGKGCSLSGTYTITHQSGESVQVPFSLYASIEDLN